MGATRGLDKAGGDQEVVLASDPLTRERDRELLERKGELHTLDVVLARVQHGHGGVAVVDGPAGIGKTQLLEATRERATAAGLRALRARASELEFDYPFGVVRQLFEPAVVDIDHAGSLFAGAAGLARDLVDPTSHGSPGVVEDRFAILHALYWLTANVADRWPLLLLVDDLQWCDRASLEFVGYLARRLDDLPVGIMVAVRSAEAGSDEALERLGTATSIERVLPGPVTENAVRELLGRRFPEPAQEFAHACHRATAGNPLLLHELVNALAAAGTEPTAAAAAEVHGIGVQAVSRLVLQRLERLSNAAMRLARAVAVLGDRTELEDAARLAELDRPNAADAAEELVRADVLASATQLGFVHPLARDAVYNSLAPSERQAAHVRAALMFAEAGAPAKRVALHLLHTPPGTAPGAVEVLRDASRPTLAEGAPEAAASFLRRALAEEAISPLRGALLYELGSAELAIDPSAAVEHLREAVELLDDAERRSGATLLLGHALYLAGRGSEAINLLEHGRANAPAVPDLLDRYEYELVNALMGTVQLERALDRVEHLYREYVSAARAVGPVGLALLAFLSYTRPLSRDEGLAFASAALDDDALFRAETFDAFTSATAALLAGDEYALASDVLERARDWAVASGSVDAFVWTSYQRARLALLLGELDDAEAEATPALAAAEDHALQAARAWLGSVLGEVLIERGRLDEAAPIIARCARSPTERERELSSLLVTRMRLRLAEGRPEDAVPDLEELVGRFGGRTGVPAPLTWRSAAAGVLAALRRGEEGRALAQAEVEFARPWGAPRLLGHALRILGALANGEQGIAVLREDVTVLEASPARLERAHALTELVAAGARPRRDPIESRSKLTASELRVARLASEGLTNREIAQSLFLSEKTIENHLRSVYRKLDISSRSQLPRALPARPPTS